MDNRNYIKWIRSKVGHKKITLVFAGGCIFNEKGEVLLQKRADSSKWGFPGGTIELGEPPQMAAAREVILFPFRVENVEVKNYAT